MRNLALAAVVWAGILCSDQIRAQPAPDVDLFPVGSLLGYDLGNVNSVSFRTDPIASFGVEQYTAFYDENEDLIVAKHTLGSSSWVTSNTGQTAAISDSHRTISIAVDRDGVLHVSWGHHRGPFNYIKSTAPGTLTMTPRLSLPGIDFDESELTYPEFFYLPNGDLLFTYRLGGSGNGDTYIQRYDTASESWTLLADPTILGRTGNTVNAYPNGIVFDSQGQLHWTWTWRDTANGPDENHDQLYARSPDYGVSWTRMDGTPYSLPITEASAEIVNLIPLGSYIANHSHMALDENDRPMIAQYYDPGSGRRVMLTWYDGTIWQVTPITAPIGWTRPLIVRDGWNRLFVFYVEGGSLKFAYTSDPNRVIWDHVVLAPQFKGNDPVFDRRRFDLGDGIVSIFYQHRLDQSVNVLDFDLSTYDPPLPPQETSALRALGGDGEVRLSWTAPYGAESYQVLRSATSGGPYALVGSPTEPGWIDATVVNGTTYYYVVAAFNDAGLGAQGAQVRATPQPVLSIAPIADSYVRGGIHAATNYGIEDRILAKTASDDFTRESLLRFDVRGLENADRVLLRLMPIATGSAGDATILELHRLDEDAWDETMVTWDTRPVASGAPAATIVGFTNGLPVEIDLTRIVRQEAAKDGLLSLRLISTLWSDDKIVHFGSKEHADPSNHPALIYSLDASPRIPVADTYVRSGVHADETFGTEDRFLAKLSTSDTTREAFLRFDVGGLANATQATLTLMPIAIGADGATTTLTIERIADDEWSETGMSWNTRPIIAGDGVATLTGFSTGVPIAIDLTNVVAEEAADDGWLSLRVVSTVSGGGRIVHFGSRENANPMNQPELSTAIAPPSPGSISTSLRLSLEPDGTTIRLTWNQSCSADAADYGIYAGALGDFSSHTQVDCSDDAGDFTETVAPETGDQYFFVVPNDVGAEGSYGMNSEWIERPRGIAVCRVDSEISNCP